MTIVILYILLVVSVLALVWVAMAVFRRIRKGMADQDKPTDTGLFPPRGNDEDQKQD